MSRDNLRVSSTRDSRLRGLLELIASPMPMSAAAGTSVNGSGDIISAAPAFLRDLETSGGLTTLLSFSFVEWSEIPPAVRSLSCEVRAMETAAAFASLAPCFNDIHLVPESLIDRGQIMLSTRSKMLYRHRAHAGTRFN